MAREVRGMRRASVRFEIAGRSAEDAVVFEKLSRAKARVVRIAEVNADVETFFDDRDRAVGEREVDPHVGVRPRKVRDDGRDVGAPESERRADAKAPEGTRGDVGLEPFGLGEDRFRRFEVALAFGREPHAAGVAKHELHAEPRFDRAEPTAHGRGRHRERARGVGERRRAGEQSKEGEVRGARHNRRFLIGESRLRARADAGRRGARALRAASDCRRRPRGSTPRRRSGPSGGP